MNNQLDDEEFEQMCYWCEGQELSSVWAWVSNTDEGFQEKKAKFLHALRRLILQGKIQLLNAKDGEPFRTTIDEQVDEFAEAFPTEEHEMKNGTWFYTESCPGSVLWK